MTPTIASPPGSFQAATQAWHDYLAQWLSATQGVVNPPPYEIPWELVHVYGVTIGPEPSWHQEPISEVPEPGILTLLLVGLLLVGIVWRKATRRRQRRALNLFDTRWMQTRR